MLALPDEGLIVPMKATSRMTAKVLDMANASPVAIIRPDADISSVR